MLEREKSEDKMEKVKTPKRSCRVLAISKRTRNMSVTIGMVAVFDLITVLNLADRRCK
jgi:hypothetical protein